MSLFYRQIKKGQHFRVKAIKPQEGSFKGVVQMNAKEGRVAVTGITLEFLIGIQDNTLEISNPFFYGSFAELKKNYYGDVPSSIQVNENYRELSMMTQRRITNKKAYIKRLPREGNYVVPLENMQLAPQRERITKELVEICMTNLPQWVDNLDEIDLKDKSPMSISRYLSKVPIGFKKRAIRKVLYSKTFNKSSAIERGYEYIPPRIISVPMGGLNPSY